MDAFMVVSYKTSNINVYLVGDAVELINELAIKSIPYEAVYTKRNCLHPGTMLTKPK